MLDDGSCRRGLDHMTVTSKQIGGGAGVHVYRTVDIFSLYLRSAAAASIPPSSTQLVRN